ncbi:MAG: hypothetical protein ACHQQQ_13955, partial [Bacteroidota bacterium]
VCLISGPRIFLARLMVNIIRSSNIIHHHLFPTLKRKYLCVFQQPARGSNIFLGRIAGKEVLKKRGNLSCFTLPIFLPLM